MFLFRAVPFPVPFGNRHIVMSREEQRVKSATLRQEYERVFRVDLDDYARSHPRQPAHPHPSETGRERRG